MWCWYRNLCALLSARDVYRTLSEILLSKTQEERPFVSKMVNLLNTILMTTHELFHLRDELKHFKLPVSSNLKNLTRSCLAQFDSERSFFHKQIKFWKLKFSSTDFVSGYTRSVLLCVSHVVSVSSSSSVSLSPIGEVQTCMQTPTPVRISRNWRGHPQRSGQTRAAPREPHICQ